MVFPERRQKQQHGSEKDRSFFKRTQKRKNTYTKSACEQLNVSDRTVSRWETGTNLPDLSILVELADFYDIDICEIIDGERKSENMNVEMKDTLMKAAQYATEDNIYK